MGQKTQGLWNNWDPGYVTESILASLRDKEAQVWGIFFFFKEIFYAPDFGAWYLEVF